MILFLFYRAFQVIEKSLLYYCDAIVVEFIFVFLMPKKSILDGVFLTPVLVFTSSNIFIHGEDEIVLFLISYDIIGYQ